MAWRIELGDVRAVLPTLAAESVQCVVTSPPYFGLRDYGADGQIGLEASPAEFVAALVEVFRDVRRVLRPDGVVFLNLGDSYGAGKQLIGIPWRVALALQASVGIGRCNTPMRFASTGKRRPISLNTGRSSCIHERRRRSRIPTIRSGNGR